MFSFTTKLYPVTDVRISGLSHAEQVAQFSAGGATLIQLREKHLSPRELYREAEEALCVAHARRARLMINDRVDIALALQADGVHLGQDDLSPSVARSLLGEGAVIGFSTHNVEQAQAAANMPIDYIAIGPIFATATKADPDPVLGLDGVRRVRDVIGGIPLVAIGGITVATAPALSATGVRAIAAIAELCNAADPERRTRELVEAFR